MYESFYKLRASPFQLTPDPLFFYDSDTHRHGLIKLRQAIQNGCSITAVTGEPGTGKTELMRKFISELDAKNTVIANIPLTSLRANNILDYIATAFGVVNMGFVGDALWSKTAFLGKIQQQISSQVCEGKKFMVFIDNAESLSKSCLKKIMQLCSVRIQGSPLVQCFLFGDTSINRNLKLDVTHLGINNITSMKLSALEEHDTLRYIEHRLIEAGWQGDPEITESAHKLIYHISEGVPWHINLLCHRVFLQGFLEDTHVIDEHIVAMFMTDKQFANMEVSGSDVSAVSNVINLKSVHSGREMKGTSPIPELRPNNNVPHQQVRHESRDSISHFFGDRVEIEHADDVEEPPISIEDVQAAFDASVSDNAESLDMFEEGVSSDLFFPEMNDEVSLADIPTAEPVVSKAKYDVDASLTANVKRDSVLDRILPRIKSGYDDLTQSMQKEKSRTRYNQYQQQYKFYPALDIPTPYHQLHYNPQVDDVECLESDDGFEVHAGKSSFQIAIRASIVTSLIITLVMWVISDTRTVETKIALAPADQSVSSLTPKLEQPVKTTTPSPFSHPDARSRSLEILKK